MSDVPLPVPAVTKHRRIAPIWLLPIIALMVGAWLVWRSLLDMGPTITIEFENGEGIVPNQTQVKHKGITVGVVRRLQAKDDLTGVLVDVEIDKRVAQKRGGVPKESQFWLVQPQISLGGVSGLGTIFSGNYIGTQLSTNNLSGDSATQFVALKSAPPLPDSVPGLHIKFKTDRLGSLGVGAPIFSRQIQVGSVQTAVMLPDGSGIEIGAFIFPQYAGMVRKNTRFWNASGVQINAGLSGVQVKTESLISLLAGGISMSLPSEGESPASNGDSFFLYQDYESAETGMFVNVRFPSADGLTKGVTKVMYKGIPIGKLRDLWYRDKDDSVIGRFGIDPRFESFVTNKTHFWLVRPQLTAAGISGLEALATGGSYLAFTPNADGAPVKDHEFVAAEGPDTSDYSEPGLHLRLTTATAGSVSSGMPVYYREFVVGVVQNRVLERDKVTIHILVKPEFRYLVNASSRFWNVSGVRINANLRNGVQIQSAPVAAMLMGGIAFDTPDEKASKDIHDGHSFALLDDEKQIVANALLNQPGISLVLETDDAKGISASAPVLHRGLVVGSVESVRHREDGKAVQIKIRVTQEYQHLLKAGSRFWRAGAMDMKVSTSGMVLRVGSIAQMLDGGIAFDSFQENAVPGAAVAADDRLRLFNSREEAANAGVAVWLHLPDAKGLSTGSEIRYRGIALGQITRLQLRSNMQGVDAEAILKTEALPWLNSGSRFWKVDMAVGLARTQNLDALFGSYLSLTCTPARARKSRWPCRSR